MVVWKAKVALNLDDSCRQIQIKMKAQYLIYIMLTISLSSHSWFGESKFIDCNDSHDEFKNYAIDAIINSTNSKIQVHHENEYCKKK